MDEPKFDVKIMDENEVEQADHVVCVRKAVAEAQPGFVPQPGTREDECLECGAIVLVASTSPRKPPRICLECAMEIMEEQAQKGEEIVIALSPQGLEVAGEAIREEAKWGRH